MRGTITMEVRNDVTTARLFLVGGEHVNFAIAAAATHDDDLSALSTLANRNCTYLGMLGSKCKDEFIEISTWDTGTWNLSSVARLERTSLPRLLP